MICTVSTESAYGHTGAPPDTPDKSGHATLHHTGIGRTHNGTHVTMLIHDLQITIINTATGEILRDLILDPTRDYQPRNKR